MWPFEEIIVRGDLQSLFLFLFNTSRFDGRSLLLFAYIYVTLNILH